MIILAFREMEDELPDTIFKYFEPFFIGLQEQNGRRGLKREMDLTKKDLVHTIPGDDSRGYEVKNMRILRLIGA